VESSSRAATIAFHASGQRESGLLLFVHPSSERTVEPVRQDSSFAEKQEPHPALVLVVPCGSEAALAEGDSLRAEAGAWVGVRTRAHACAVAGDRVQSGSVAAREYHRATRLRRATARPALRAPSGHGIGGVACLDGDRTIAGSRATPTGGRSSLAHSCCERRRSRQLVFLSGRSAARACCRAFGPTSWSHR
jgi:hypothetical protein